MINKGTYIVYDGECPLCSRYVRLLRLRNAVGHVELIDARSNHAVVHRLQDMQLDLNEGMALIQDGHVSYGDECVHRLALLTTPSGIFNRLNYFIFRSAKASRALYPILRFGRNMTLKILGRKKLPRPDQEVQ